MLKVYLDSQDYSVLSATTLTHELAQIRSKLIAFAESGRVGFFFSALIVCEVAPTHTDAVSHAIRRGDFLSSLCGSNALIDTASLLRAEIEALQSSGKYRPSPYGVDGQWFPKIELDAPPPLEDHLSEAMAEEATARGLSRQARRAFERRILKNGAIRSFVRPMLDRAPKERLIQQICEKYPMKPQSAESLRRYVMGKGQRDEAEKALEDSLRDPCWLMRWFAANPELARPLSEIVRTPGRKMGEQFREIVQSFVALRSKLEGTGDSQTAKNMLSKLKWNSMTNEMVVRVATRMTEASEMPLQRAVTVTDVGEFCPGLDAAARSMTSSIWDNIGGSRKELPSDSQFPDSMHSIYGPYVDIFRADTFMAPHIRSQIQRHGTTVVSKLTQLPAAIEERVAN